MKNSIGSAVIFSFLFNLGPSWAQGPSSQNETALVSSPLNEPKVEKTVFPAGLIAIPVDEYFSNHSIVVDKAKRKLMVYEGQGEKIKRIAEFPADIGKKAGDKQRENDHRTPVGIYFLEERLSQPKIPFDLYGSLAFTTDYPNIFDRRIGKTGHGIWLHAVPDTIPLTRGSRGCVVVRDNVIKDLEQYVKLGQTPIVIFDEIDYVDKDTYITQRNEFLKHFESWRTSWESQDVDTYMKFYDPTFRNANMNFNQWYRHKKGLKEKYEFIKVELGPPLILQNKDQIVIRTVQRYQSDKHQDYGEKTIHAHYDTNNGFRIVREDWRPLPDPLSTQIRADLPSETSAEDVRKPTGG